jgi:hypothetical protein
MSLLGLQLPGLKLLLVHHVVALQTGTHALQQEA